MEEKEEIRSLASYLAELHEKIDSNYSANIEDNRFTLREWCFLFAATGKLLRLMFVDTTGKVPDDAIDIVGYMELFWQSFQKRNKMPVKIRGELYR